jgi:hypothetical protein
LSSVSRLGVVAALATTGASMASRMPVTLGEVDTMRCGSAACGAAPAPGAAPRGRSAATANTDTTAAAPRAASFNLFISI